MRIPVRIQGSQRRIMSVGANQEIARREIFGRSTCLFKVHAVLEHVTEAWSVRINVTVMSAISSDFVVKEGFAAATHL